MYTVHSSRLVTIPQWKLTPVPPKEREEKYSAPAQTPWAFMWLAQTPAPRLGQNCLCAPTSPPAWHSLPVYSEAPSFPGPSHLRSLLATVGDLIIKGLFESPESLPHCQFPLGFFPFLAMAGMDRASCCLPTVLDLPGSPWPFNLICLFSSYSGGCLQLPLSWMGPTVVVRTWPLRSMRQQLLTRSVCDRFSLVFPEATLVTAFYSCRKPSLPCFYWDGAGCVCVGGGCFVSLARREVYFTKKELRCLLPQPKRDLGLPLLFPIVKNMCSCLFCNRFCCVLHAIFSFISFSPLKIKSSEMWKKEKCCNPHSCRVFLEGKDISILKLVLKHEIIVLWNSCLVKNPLCSCTFLNSNFLKTTRSSVKISFIWVMNYFQSFEWLLKWWNWLEQNRCLFFCLVVSGGEGNAIGILGFAWAPGHWSLNKWLVVGVLAFSSPSASWRRYEAPEYGLHENRRVVSITVCPSGPSTMPGR